MAIFGRRILRLAAISLLVFATHAAFAQFGGSISGVVADPSGAVVPGAEITLRNVATNEQRMVATSNAGIYQFVSLAPGSYELSATMKGFSTSRITVTLQTNQPLDVPVKLSVGVSTETVNVSSEGPLLDTDDTRVQETLPTETLSALPLAGRNMISLVTLAPGVTGTGVTSNGSPGSGRDNYSTETQVDASANGQGAVGNMYIVDGLDVSSSIRPGVLNLTPNPDSIQEATIQTNTYNVDYGRASSIQMTMTTKSGTNRYHGVASDYFTYQKFLSATEFTHKYNPFHSNNISAAVGGPIVPHHGVGFFFFAIEPLRASNAVTSNITFNDAAFAAWAKTAFPNTIGTKLLNTYPVSNVSNVKVIQTAATLYPVNTNGSPICGTPSTFNLPCNTPVLDSGGYSDTAYRNGSQYNIRVDKNFGKERLYGTFYRTTLNNNGTNARAAFKTTNTFGQYAIQGNETHTFSASTLNEASFAMMRVEGVQPATGLFSIPVVNVTGGGQGFGSGFAQGDFIQHNYHWRDVLTHTFRSHTIKIGYEGLFADDVEVFNGPYDQPTFTFKSLLDLASDNVFTETSVAYDPISGVKTQYSWDAAGTTHGAFAEDTWKVNRKLTVNYGLRWDDFGNPYSRSPSTAFGNFFMGPGPTLQARIANGSVIAHHHALNRSVSDVFSPRFGVAWDAAGDGKWLVKGGFGFFHNWPTLANLQEQYRGNPPGNIFPTFQAGSSPAPIFGLGTSNDKPFNFPYPVLPARPLNAKGGITGLQFNIGGIDPDLVSPVTYTYSAALDRELGRHLVSSFIYTGAAGRKLLSGGGQVFNVSYGQDINVQAGDLIANNSLIPTRLNTSFGQVNYTQNDRVSNYNAVIVALRGRFKRAFFNASYTHSASKDDTQVYPTYIDPHQYYAPSIWDSPNRFSLAWNYEFPGYGNGEGVLGRVTSGWQLSGTTIAQNGNPFTVATNAPFSPLKNSSGQFIGYAANSGDYNADGDNRDYPDVVSYSYKRSRKDYLNGVFTPSNFAKPTFGQEGNERYSAFRAPNFQQWDAALLKNTTFYEALSFQLRFEFFNVLNHPNLTNMDTNLPDGNFGKATGQAVPRFIQIGGKLTF
ncbi:MAG TPA: carboxypeptidase-like regulatory domain-containing protein [Acidobacteriaceae bacterium]|nr:carboxypeptidase-like regulatory domain-containing protein [Acidobacteriaceae bacterium]